MPDALKEQVFKYLDQLAAVANLSEENRIAYDKAVDRYRVSRIVEEDIRREATEEGLKENERFMLWIRQLAEEKNATPAQISLAWMRAKKPYIVPIPGTRKVNRLEENMKSADIKLTQDEVKSIDDRLNHMPMSQVFGGSKIQKK